MNKLKVILLVLVAFFLSIALAFYYENNYRMLVRFFLTLFQGEKIKFSGKNFHLFASYYFVIGFGLYCVLLTLMLYQQTPRQILIYLLTSLLLFFMTTSITTFADSTIKVSECTACHDGIRTLHYNAVNYDFHFILSLAVSLLPSLWLYYKNKKNPARNKMVGSRNIKLN